MPTCFNIPLVTSVHRKEFGCATKQLIIRRCHHRERLRICLVVEHIKRLPETGSELDKIEADLEIQMIPVSWNRVTSVVIEDDILPIALNGRVSMNSMSSANSSAASVRSHSSGLSRSSPVISLARHR